MKILMVFQRAPYPPDIGPSKRNFPFFLENIKRHEVSVLAYGTPEEEDNFRKAYGEQCRHVVFINNKRPRVINVLFRIWRLFTGQSSYRQLWTSRFQDALDQLLAKGKFDLIHCCTTILGYHRLPVDTPLVGDMHNVEYDLMLRSCEQTKNVFRKPYFYWEYWLLKKDEVRITDKFDVVVTTTERDREVIARELPDKCVHAIPNGVDPTFFLKQPVEEEPRTMVFTGLMSYYPNFHGIMYFLDEIFPRILEQEPSARIKIVGAYPPLLLRRRAGSNIIVTGFVDDVKPYIASGRVYIIPLLMGGGIRGKALEAMAMRRPIVSTSLGCEGINLHHGQSALFADTPQGFADEVVRLFSDDDARAKLTCNAHATVIRDYSWSVNGMALDRVYQSLLPSSNGSVKNVNNSATANTLNSTETINR